jgi:hypothetical protein
MDSRSQKKKLELVDLIGDKEAKELIQEVSTYEGWKSSMKRDRTQISQMFKRDANDTLEIKNAYKSFAQAPHIEAELKLQKIIEFKSRVDSWITRKIEKNKEVVKHPRLQAMLALKEHLMQRQAQLETHLEEKQKEGRRQTLMKEGFEFKSFAHLHEFFAPPDQKPSRVEKKSGRVLASKGEHSPKASG